MRHARALLLLAPIIGIAAGVRSSAQTLAAAEPETAQAAPLEWQTVTDWSGRGAMQTEPFTTTSSEWRIYWRTKEEALPGAGILHIMVHRANDDALVTSAAYGQSTGSEIAYVCAAPGSYYLTIDSAHVDWLVRVEDQRRTLGPPTRPSDLEQKAEAEISAAAKRKAAASNMSEWQARRDIVTMFIGELVQTQLLKAFDVEHRATFVNGTMWQRIDRDHKELIVRRLADFREVEKGQAEVVIYDAESGRELASYSPTQGLLFR